jgi:hypothetical protein
VIVRLEQLDSFENLSLGLKVSTFTTPSKVIMSCNLCTIVNVYVFLFTYYKVMWHAWIEKDEFLCYRDDYKMIIKPSYMLP